MVLSTQSASAKASLTRPWPAEQVELWPIERLIPYANNPRLHSAVDIKRIAASILKWGWTNPVLADEHGVLIAGHCRVAVGADGADPGDRRARLERGGEAGLSPGRQ